MCSLQIGADAIPFFKYFSLNGSALVDITEKRQGLIDPYAGNPEQ